MSFSNKTDFIAYLQETLIPDLRESGRDFTADDFETAIRFMQEGTKDLKVAVDVSDKQMAYLLCSGMEGGIGYWSKIVSYRKPPKLTFTMDGDEKTGHIYKHIDYPMNPGGSVTLELTEGDVNGKTTFKLDRKALERGLKVMAEVAPRHFANFIEENEDAETGDVFIQCALFGEIVFG
jgi:hypothetical protein